MIAGLGAALEHVAQSVDQANAADQKKGHGNTEVAKEGLRTRPTAADQISHAYAPVAHAIPDEGDDGPLKYHHQQIANRASIGAAQGRQIVVQSARK